MIDFNWKTSRQIRCNQFGHFHPRKTISQRDKWSNWIIIEASPALAQQRAIRYSGDEASVEVGRKVLSELEYERVGNFLAEWLIASHLYLMRNEYFMPAKIWSLPRHKSIPNPTGFIPASPLHHPSSVVSGAINWIKKFNNFRHELQDSSLKLLSRELS